MPPACVTIAGRTTVVQPGEVRAFEVPLAWSGALALSVKGEAYVVALPTGRTLAIGDNPCGGFEFRGDFLDPCITRAGAPGGCATRSRVTDRITIRSPDGADPDRCPTPDDDEPAFSIDSFGGACRGLGPYGYCTYPSIAAAGERVRFLPPSGREWIVTVDEGAIVRLDER